MDNTVATALEMRRHRHQTENVLVSSRRKRIFPRKMQTHINKSLEMMAQTIVDKCKAAPK